MNAADAAAGADLGRPSARKSGRTPERPYVPIVLLTGSGREIESQILGRAFKTRAEAVAYAEAKIAADRDLLQYKMEQPRYRRLREHYGVTDD